MRNTLYFFSKNLLIALMLFVPMVMMGQVNGSGYYRISENGYSMQPSSKGDNISTSNVKPDHPSDIWQFIGTETSNVYTIKNSYKGLTLVFDKRNWTMASIDRDLAKLVNSPSSQDYFIEMKVASASNAYCIYPNEGGFNSLYSLSPQGYSHTTGLEDGLIVLGKDHEVSKTLVTSSRWTVTPVTVAVPTFEYNTPTGKVTLKHPEAGYATLYHGTASGSVNTAYTEPFSWTSDRVYAQARLRDSNGTAIVSSAETSYTPVNVETPVITVTGDNAPYHVTITCLTSGARIYYAINGVATPDSPEYPTGGFDFAEEMGTITAIAVKSDSNGNRSLSGIAEEQIKPAEAESIKDCNDLKGMASSGYYIIEKDIEVDDCSFSSISTFSGTLEAMINPATNMPYRIIGLKAPLFTTLTGTVKNLVLEGVNIPNTTAGNVGAIAASMEGTSTDIACIFNCGILSGSVGGTGHVGGLVGDLGVPGNTTATNDRCYARVVNCYSYANITGGTVKAGIVGYNNYASKYNDLRTMVMNSMFYGDITEGNTISPIYGGLMISNDYNKNSSGTANKNNRLNNYNYFLYEADFSYSNRITQYNCALAAEERFLARFEFYRHLLNSTRELAAWYATGSASNGAGVGAHNKMLKWVLDKTIAPYPILKQQGSYPSVVNYAGAPSLNKTLSVTISSVGSNAPEGSSITNGSLTLDRTDKDPANYNFNYDKVQLPYYNEVGTGNCTHNKAVTGWKITSMTGGTQGTFTASDQWDGYNFADRAHYAKDLYGTSGRVFSQGGYFNVPEGVTAITIEPYWANAVYLSDACYDRYGYGNSDNASDNLTQVGGGQRYIGGGTYSINGDNQVVYTTIATALEGLNNASSVYDNAVVLVGNYHHSDKIGSGNGNELASDQNKAFTIMSIDLNEDNEPDYSLIFRSGKQKTVSPIRYDFINVPALSMAHKMASHTDLAIPGNCKPLGWFEITTTALIRYNQFEYDSESKKIDAPIIMMAGVIEQFVSTNGNVPKPWRTKYLLFGDNVWFKVCSNGCHMEKKYGTPHIPISVTGGDYEKFYLSGYFAPKAVAANDDAEGYIDGGRFGEVAGGGQEEIKGNATWLIDHADIENFYAGGVNAAKAIKGDITTTIKNSHVGIFCGGPKFGDMASTRTIGVTATNCTFGMYFGAGFGGTSSYKHQVYNKYQALNYNEWNDTLNKCYTNTTRGYYKVDAANDINGILYDYEYELFAGSTGNVHRLYMLYASFSLAQTNNATSTLTDCTITGNYYGGGSLGAVNGNVTSVLNNTTVLGNVFGAGYSATVPKVSVRNLGGFNPEPYYNQTTGVYVQAGFPETTQYEWTTAASLSSGDNALNDTYHTIKTTLATSGLGVVTGNISLTLKGNTTVGTQGDDNTGNVFGGGDESAVSGNTIVTLKGYAHVLGNVYGGGNKGQVSGNSEVRIENE